LRKLKDLGLILGHIFEKKSIGVNALVEIAFLRRAQDRLLPDFIGVASRNVDGDKRHYDFWGKDDKHLLSSIVSF
jgi:hypothetical protein